ncbi:hypothetical protein C8R28_102242 [Nitrosomonas ureae]|uniref:Uncharacterized protein n=1 Tax=Nitrosomonas ureae TaxID=44577 RepID=A0A286AC31_9PROT|nr:hypothetical protein C8R28_102242 [Nitrosomonas ureae]SOD19459.1 hypothetical protein SAMN06297164_2457 [Nitrosomonas ureae]
MKIRGGVISELNLLFQRKLIIGIQRTFPHMKFHLEKIEKPKYLSLSGRKLFTRSLAALIDPCGCFIQITRKESIK